MNGFILAASVISAFLAGYLVRGALAVIYERKQAREIKYVHDITTNWTSDKAYR